MTENDLILLVEDDEIYQKTIQRAFKDLEIKNPLQIFSNGKLALEYFSASDYKIPCLILLDLRMPVMNGIEFLREIRKLNIFIPAIILTTSKENKDLKEVYRLGASGFMFKPIQYSDFVSTLRIIHNYWSYSLTPADIEP